MSVLLRFLGIAAFLGQRMSRTRGNGIPMNWFAMGGVLFLFGYSCVMLRDGLVNGATPQQVPLRDVLEHREGIGRNYIKVTGIVLPENRLERVSRNKNTGEETTRDIWVPLADAGHKGVLWMQWPKGELPVGPPHAATFAGMLVPINDAVRKELEGSPEAAKVGFDLSYMLVVGKTPASPWLWGPIALVSGLCGGALLLTFLTKYVVFHKTGTHTLSEQGELGDAPLPELRATGRFTLDAKTAQRFSEVPVGLGYTKSGEPALVAHVDASNYFMGTVSESRVGFWGLVLGELVGQTVDIGELYWAGRARPALRIRTPKSGVALLSVASAAERESLLGILLKKPTPKEEAEAEAEVETQTETEAQATESEG